MSGIRIDRRQVFQISAAAAAAAAAGGTSALAQSGRSGVLGYDLPAEPLPIAGAERFFVPGTYSYEWDGKPSAGFPNGSRETGEVTVTAREEGPGVTYVIDSTLVFTDGGGTEQTQSDRTSVVQIFPTIEGQTGVVIHSTFGVNFLGHVVEMDDDRIVFQIVGLSQSLAGPTFGRFEFTTSDDGFDIVGRARQDVNADWDDVTVSRWVRM